MNWMYGIRIKQSIDGMYEIKQKKSRDSMYGILKNSKNLMYDMGI